MNKTWQVEFIPEQNPIKVEFKEIIAHKLEIASPDVLGGVRPCKKTEEMIQPVGVDADGALWTENGTNIDLTGYATE